MSPSETNGSNSNSEKNTLSWKSCHFVFHPVVSDKSKVFLKSCAEQEGRSNAVAGSSRKTRNGGKLSQIVSMPMDILFEVMALLHPRDLLSLARASRSFREVLMDRSLKWIWAAARKNAQDLPQPPDILSEPKYASVLFERDCQACGIPRAGKESFALSIRLCGACWKANIFTRRTMLQNHQELEAIADTIFSLINSHKGGYHGAEVEAVAKHYFDLPDSERDKFVEQRRAYVTMMEEHEQAVLEWQRRVRSERASDEWELASRRETSILTRLLEMGYSKDALPDRFYTLFNPEWRSLVRQPRELTEQIWKRILPKLERCISQEAERKDKIRRRHQSLRVIEANINLDPYLDEFFSTFGNVLTTYEKLRAAASDGLRKKIEEGDGNSWVTHEFIDSIVPAIIAAQNEERRALYMNALRYALYPELSEDDVKLQPLPDPDSVIALFPCLYCADCTVDRNYSFAELEQHVKSRHFSTHVTSSSGSSSPSQSVEHGLSPKRFKVDIVRHVLKMLEIPEDARYQDISSRIVCLCGKPGLEQPAQFSALIHHIAEECDWYTKQCSYRNGRCVTNPDVETIFNDHDFDSSTPFLRFLHENETFEAPEVVVPQGFSLQGSWISQCKGCLCRFTIPTVKEFAWHIRAKHHQEPSKTFVF